MLALALSAALAATSPAPAKAAGSAPPTLLQRVVRRYQSASQYWIESDVTRWDQPGADPSREVYEVAAASGGRFRDLGPEWIRVSDGTTAFHFVPPIGQYTRKPPTPGTPGWLLEPLFMSKGFLSLAQILNAKEARLVRRDSIQVDGARRAVAVLRITGSLGENITFWVDPRSAAVLRDSVSLDLTGALGQILPPSQRSTVRVLHQYTERALAGPVPDSVFTFRPPVGASAVASLDYTAPGRSLEGAPAPDFTLPDLDGHLWTLSAFRGRMVLLHFRMLDATIFKGDSNLEVLQQVGGPRGPSGIQTLCAWVTVNPDVVRDEATRNGIADPKLLDETGTVAAAYHAMAGCFVLIGPEGRVRKWLVDPSAQDLAHMVEDAER